ncbi:MAG: hypothetical protein MK141_14200 [Pseudoxanthomonas sp.]|uniref:hypothetical protein n=1 Tax=Pseudoxanthomonas sp. TaxID=1871049 RepID=UPI002585961D|nr:hypothetical protein [Pseudoxanthomonas sp.]MCH2092711.1 hypothetical protein [Pseudoxanthomonas sp.]
MLDGSGGEGNRVAQRDYYEIERLEQRLEIQGLVPCDACELRLVRFVGEHCKVCRHERAMQKWRAEAVQFVMVWGGMTALIAKLGHWLFNVMSMTSLMASAGIAVIAYHFLQRALFDLEFWLQHRR